MANVVDAARRKRGRARRGAAPSRVAPDPPARKTGQKRLTRISRRAPAMAPAPVDGGSSCASSSSGTVSRSASLGGIGGASSRSPSLSLGHPPRPLLPPASVAAVIARERARRRTWTPVQGARIGPCPLQGLRGGKCGKGGAGVVLARREAVFLVFGGGCCAWEGRPKQRSLWASVVMRASLNYSSKAGVSRGEDARVIWDVFEGWRVATAFS